MRHGVQAQYSGPHRTLPTFWDAIVGSRAWMFFRLVSRDQRRDPFGGYLGL